jgi:hypothetical protein
MGRPSLLALLLLPWPAAPAAAQRVRADAEVPVAGVPVSAPGAVAPAVLAPLSVSPVPGAAPALSAPAAAVPAAPLPAAAAAAAVAPAAAPSAVPATAKAAAPRAAPALTGTAARLDRDGKAPAGAKAAGALDALYDGAASPGGGAVPVAASDAPDAPRASGLAKGPPRLLARFPAARGEITWRQALSLANPNSRHNRLRVPFRFDAERRKEAEMYRANLGYVLGLRSETYEQEKTRLRLEAQKRLRDERSAKARARYGLPPLASVDAPVVALGRSLGKGVQGEAFADARDPSRAVKVFDRAAPEQVQEMAAILNAVADQGHDVERVRLVRTEDGRWGLEMRNLSREDGWTDLDLYAHVHGARASREAVARAHRILGAVGRESEAALGVDAADWKYGLTGGGSDEFLENFKINAKTGEVTCFDCLVLW